MPIKFAQILFAASLLALLPATAAVSPTNEPDKSMDAAHESFLKKDAKASSEHIAEASTYVKKQSEDMAEDSKADVKKAGENLDKLGDGVKKGSVKSDDEMKKVFAETDRALANGWHKTAEESRKAGKDSTDALKKAGQGLEGAAKWSGKKIDEGTQVSIEAVRKTGEGFAHGSKEGAKNIEKWSKSLGEGIKKLAHTK